VEIDLTSPFIGDGPAHRAAPKRLIPAAKLPAAPVEAPLPPEPPKPVVQEPPKNWTPVGTVRPKLLNRDEVLRNLRKYYPERERILGHEGLVIVDIHLGADGSVGGVDVIQSASPLFDAAAIKVAGIMRFSPAQTPDGAAVASKVRERMQFKLTDD
jgi:TonB family protein